MTESGHPYRTLAQALEGVASSRGKLAKIERLAAALASLEGSELAAAARLLSGNPYAEWEQAVTSVGWATLARAAAGVTGWDLETIGASARAIGDLGEAVGLLVPREPAGPPLSIGDVDAGLRSLSGTRKAAEKGERIEELLRRASPVEAKYIAKTLSGGLRVGAEVTTVEEAIAAAFGADRETVARGRRDSGDIGETALAAREGRLEAIRFRLFHPIGFMLASPIEDPDEIASELPLDAVENKFDGIRAHAHKSGSRVTLFSRTLDDVTAQFPEIALALGQAPGQFLLDGEIVAWRENRVDSFFKLQRRLGRKAPPPELLAEIPVAFVAYDCLATGETPLFERPWRERRTELERIAAGGGFVLSEVFRAADAAGLESLFGQARARGNEGLMLKREDSPYQAGKRGRAWRKWKKALATLDVVVTAVEQGNGKRAGMLSDYTFAVRDGDRLVNIGKAYSGLTDEEIRTMGNRFRKITVARYGPVRAVAPEVVIEVAFDTIQKSNRHKSGYALRFPRIVRIRDDKKPEEADTVETVETIWKGIQGIG
ncbi:MAG: ATP-dependent DNA ligase [Acidobacteriota bacterium]|nr:ATP-dependent DNA ligase [Acidobacteriota bacterium]